MLADSWIRLKKHSAAPPGIEPGSSDCRSDAEVLPLSAWAMIEEGGVEKNLPRQPQTFLWLLVFFFFNAPLSKPRQELQYQVRSPAGLRCVFFVWTTIPCFRVSSSCLVTIANSFSHNTSSQFFPKHLKMAGATRSKRRDCWWRKIVTIIPSGAIFPSPRHQNSLVDLLDFRDSFFLFYPFCTLLCFLWRKKRQTLNEEEGWPPLIPETAVLNKSESCSKIGRRRTRCRRTSCLNWQEHSSLT